MTPSVLLLDMDIADTMSCFGFVMLSTEEGASGRQNLMSDG